MNKIMILLIAVMLSAVNASARQLTAQEALRRAQGSPTAMRALSFSNNDAPRLVYTETTEGMNTLYVFDSSGGGFVVLPADDAIYAPVLGYSESGSFDAAAMPDNVRWWLGQYSREIRAAATYDVDGGEAPTSDTRAEIEPILTTYWNQTSPYNALTPEVYGEHCPTGCVATAMAQVMNKWKYPEHGTGSKTYVASYLTQEEVTVDFANTTYNWDAMLDRYSEDSPQESKDAVATLMLSCGVASSMSYAPNASGTNYTVASEALVTYFGYDKGLRDLSRNYYGLEEWTDMLYSELAAGRPVLYGGQNDEGGHAFVIDGYRTDGYFHLNWGWGGTSNGYFLVTALNPKEQGVGGSTGGYNKDQAMVIGVQPAQADSKVVPVVEFMSDFSLDESQYDRASTSTVEVYDIRGIFNMSVVGLDLVFGLRLTDDQGRDTYIAASEPDSLKRGQGIRSYMVPVSEFPQSGTYSVRPAVSPTDDEAWTDALVGMDNNREYTLVATPETLVFTPVAEPKLTQTNLCAKTSIFAGEEWLIAATLSNLTAEEYYQEVTPALLNGHSEVARGESIAVDLEGGMSGDFEWVGTFPSTLSPGAYTLVLLDGSNKIIGSGVEVTVKARPTETAEPYFPSVLISGNEAAGNTEETPVNADLANWEADVTVGNQAGYFADYLKGGLWYSDTEGLEELEGNFVGIEEGQTAKVHFSRDLTGFSPTHVYQLRIFGVKKGYFGPYFYFRADPAAGIMSIDAPERMSVFTDGLTEAHVAGPSEVVSITLYDLNGLEVVSEHDSAVGLDNLRSGVYILRATDTAGARYTFRIMRL